MRNHITNPTITVLMETVGRESIASAIRSFIAQDYQFARLLVINRHPSPLRLLNVPESHRMRIEVVNDEDTYLRPVYQHIASLKMVRTDCWTILDDDDWLDNNHLSQLVEAWNKCTDRNEKPLSVSGMNYLCHYEDKTEPLRFRGWAVTLFETLTPDEVDLCFKLFPHDLITGPDTWIAGNSYYDKREFDGKPTYHWDRKGSSHVSQHETNNGDTPQKRFATVENYWRIKLAARAAELKLVQL